VDATLQVLMRGEADSDALFAVIKESLFDVARDEDGRPITAPSPDDVPSLLVSTAPAQRFRVHTEHWRVEVTATELSDLLRSTRRTFCSTRPVRHRSGWSATSSARMDRSGGKGTLGRSEKPASGFVADSSAGVGVRGSPVLTCTLIIQSRHSLEMRW
jgi:hypothetical protein